MGDAMPRALASGFLKTLNPYTCPMHMWTAMAAGGTIQRLKPGGAMVAERSRKLMIGLESGDEINLSPA